MKKIIIASISIFLLCSSALAATCEMKMVCIDNNHVGFQDTDCTIKSAAEIGSGFGAAESSYSCYVGCKDGACIEDSTPYTCTDTDGGTDYFVKGTVSAKGNGEQATGADACTDKSTVSETSCGKNSSGNYTIKITPYKCPNGCLNGACIKTASGGSGSTCTDSDGGKDIFKAGIITINGKIENISDTCGLEPQTITERYCLPNGTVASEDIKCPGLCEILPDTYGHAYCTKSCEKSDGYYCHKTPEGKTGIAFLTKDCKWEKITPCQSNSCASICMSVGNLIDTDGDGLLDVNEAKWGTDPNKFDTDGDGYGDMTEIYGGFNPVGDGKFTPTQVVLAGQMASAGNTPISSTDDINNLVATPTADIINSTATDIIVPAVVEPINTTSSFNALANTIISDFGGYFVVIIIILFLLLYVYCALCLQFIAKKLVINGLWMAWVPIANLFLILKCAGRPYWWFLLMFVPIANIIVALVPWMDITEKLGKSKWLGLLMIVAPLNLILMGYLAFSQSYSSNSQNNYTQPVS
ncbi:MAG: DUF5684 domain-containing protein [Patescibacteria group bacterium]|jgi:hypothetical protein